MRPVIAHYRILEKLGEGGMGEVWKAQDTTLDRPVAIKILPPDKVADAERKRRFVQEAKSASSLNHPSIVTIYEIGSDAGLDYIAMEFVPGQTLDRLIGAKGIPVKQAIAWAAQIAGALARAHARGIVHRDVKPGNVMIGEEGGVKVLDFGLSKLLEPAGGGEDGATATMMNAPRTEEGKLIGTVAYMSPEQAEGRPVDARSDIFSFGAVLYEMVTGQRPFTGDSKISVLAGILREEPAAASSIAHGVPLELDRIIGRCLRKDPARRYQHMDDVRIALEDVKQESEAGTRPAGRNRQRRRRTLALAAFGAALAAGAVGVWKGAKWQEAQPQAPPKLVRVTYDSGLTTDAALSPDGRLIAYASDRAGEGSLDIWVQQLAGGDPTRITSGAEDEYEPVFSPDGTRIAYRWDAAGGGIYSISALGGQPRLITPEGRGPRYSPDGRQIAFWKGSPTHGTPWAPGAASIWTKPAEGGQARQVVPDFSVAARPEWTADGKHLMVVGVRQQGDSPTTWVAPLDGGAAINTGIRGVLDTQQLRSPERYARFVRGAGSRFYFAGASAGVVNLWSVAFAAPTWHAEGLRRLTTGTESERLPSVGGGRVAFTSGNDSNQIWSVRIDANRGQTQGAAEQLTHGADSTVPVLTRDGTKLCFTTSRPNERRAIVRNLASRTDVAVASAPGLHHPVISPSGDMVAYRVGQDTAGFRLFVVSASGGPERKLCDDCGMTLGWTNDDKYVLYKQGSAVGMLDAVSGQKTALLRHPKYEVWQPQISADGRWVVFLANDICIAPFRPGVPPEEWITVIKRDAENDKPRWSPDGQLVYYTSTRDGFRCIWAQRVNGSTKRPVGESFAVLHFHSASRSLSNVHMYSLETAVAAGRLVFVLGERRGNIWMVPEPGN